MKINTIKQIFTGLFPLLIASMLVFFAGCGEDNPKKSKQLFDSPTNGIIRISVDESFKPVIDSQIKVYEASYPDAHIIAEYKPEAECLKDLERDSTRLVIVTRGLTQPEADGIKVKLKFSPSWGLLAYDAVAVVMNRNAKDSLITVGDLRSMLNGSSGYKYKIVMDGLTATSTVRYALDSILRGQKFSTSVVAAKSSPEVINFVAADPNAIGLLGVSWVGDRDDAQQLSFLDKVTLVSMRCENCENEAYVKPYQANIAYGRYPLLRGLYFILKENYIGLGRGFVDFLGGERGQLIFKRAYILPAKMNFSIRTMKVNETK